MRKVIVWAVAALIALAGVGEVAVRATGLVDFPLYGRDDELGYWIQPNQQGKFMGKNEWAFNDRGMPIARDYQPTEAIDVPVIGNSIIMGGNAYKQKDKVGPLLQNTLGSGFNIWPVAVGGWSNVNQAVYLTRHPDVAAHADLFIWEVMHGGFSQPAQWRSEYVFPTQAPVSALWYFSRRYVLPRFIDFDMSELPPVGQAKQTNLALIEGQIQKLVKASGQKHPGMFFIYPDRHQLAAAKAGQEWLPDRPAVEMLARKYNLMIVDISKNKDWTAAHYREGTHPNEEGNRFIARTLAEAVQSLQMKNDGRPQITADSIYP
jgi:hypothetical protein